jgi:putative transposase
MIMLGGTAASPSAMVNEGARESEVGRDGGPAVRNVQDRGMESEKKELAQRKSPIHLPNLERHNQPVILFVTVCAKDHQPILANDIMHTAILEAWSLAGSHRVGRYTLMPDHLHLFCSPAWPEAENVRKWVGYWKRLVSRRVEREEPIWQRDCWDTQIRDADHYSEKWQYMVGNPVRKGLIANAEAWPYQGEVCEFRW